MFFKRLSFLISCVIFSQNLYSTDLPDSEEQAPLGLTHTSYTELLKKHNFNAQEAMAQLPIDLMFEDYKKFLENKNFKLRDDYKFSEYYTETGANNAHSFLGHKNRKELKPLIGKYFNIKDGEYYLQTVLIKDEKNLNQKRPVSFSNTDLKLLWKFINIYFSDDEDLRRITARVLSNNNTLESCQQALWLFAQEIVTGHYQGEGFYGQDTVEYLKILSKLHITFPKGTIKLNPLLTNLTSLIMMPDVYMKKHQIKNLTPNKFKKTLSSYCKPLFYGLYVHFKDKIYGDAAFLSLCNLQNSNISEKDTDYLRDICPALFGVYPSIHEAPPLIVVNYAECLAGTNRYKEAIPIYKFLVSQELNPMNPETYNRYGTCLAQNEQHAEASKMFDQSLRLRSNDQVAWNKACADLLSRKDHKDNSHILETMKYVYELTVVERVEHSISISPHEINMTYQYALAEMDQTNTLNALLLERQTKLIKKIADRERKKGKAIASTIEIKQKEKRLEQQQQKVSFAPQGDTSPRGIPQISTSSETPSWETSKDEKYIAPEMKVKKKTKGNAAPQKLLTSPVHEDLEPAYSEFLYIENIQTKEGRKISPHARGIFNKLFTLYPGGSFNNNISITLHEIEMLFKSLNQEYDPSKGQGSHKKATLNLQEFGSSLEEQMIILTKDKKLKEYTIKQIRESFIKARIIPNDPAVIEILKQNFPHIFQQQK